MVPQVQFGPYRARLWRVVDGDTVYLLVDVGLGELSRPKLRLRRINCPELGTPEGETAKRYTTDWFTQAATGPKDDWPLTIQTTHNEVDRYDRFLAEVYRHVDGHNLSDDLLQAGLAKKYP